MRDLGLGHLAALMAATFSSLANVIVRKIGNEERSTVLLLYPMMSNFLVMGALLGFVYQPMPGAHVGGFAAMAVLGTVAGLLFIAAYKRGRGGDRGADAVFADPLGDLLRLRHLWRDAAPEHHHRRRRSSSPRASTSCSARAAGRRPENTPVLSSMDMARDRGVRPTPSVWARLRPSR